MYPFPSLSLSITKLLIFVLLLVPAAVPAQGTKPTTAPVKKQFALDEIFNSGKFEVRSPGEVMPLQTGPYYCGLLPDNRLLKYEYRTGNVVDTLIKDTLLMDNGKRISFSSYDVSADESKVLLATDVEQIYRHSTKANYYVYDRASGSVTQVSGGGKQMYATFSPDGKRVAFVRENNLFVRDLGGIMEVQLTYDGKINSIINGATDWVYEEEFSFDRGFFWSPDGTKIAYYRFDESKVKEFSLTMYGDLYPSETKYKYPKAGEVNSTVDVYIYDATTRFNRKLNIGSENDQYIPRIKWTSDSGTLSLLRLNRRQNKLELLLANTMNGEIKVALTEEDKAYIDITDDLTFLKDKQHFIWSSELNGFNHLFLYNISGQMEKQLTTGNWDVVRLLGVDESKQTVFYQSAEISPLEKHIYSVKLDGTGKKQLTTMTGANSAAFSTGCDYFICTHTDANTPPVYSMHDADGNLLRVLEENAELKKTLAEYAISPKEFFLKEMHSKWTCLMRDTESEVVKTHITCSEKTIYHLHDDGECNFS